MEANELPFRPLGRADFDEVREQLAAVAASLGQVQACNALARGDAPHDGFYRVRHQSLHCTAQLGAARRRSQACCRTLPPGRTARRRPWRRTQLPASVLA